MTKTMNRFLKVFLENTTLCSKPKDFSLRGLENARPWRGCPEALLFAMYYFLMIASFILYYIYLYRL
jgi:hypothetical protein